MRQETIIEVGEAFTVRIPIRNGYYCGWGMGMPDGYETRRFMVDYNTGELVELRVSDGAIGHG